MALPPLQRLDGDQKGYRITKQQVGLLPQDRITILFKCEIPPAQKQTNVLQMTFSLALNYSTQLPLFLKTRHDLARSVGFKKQGNQFIAENPTPYYITIIGLSIN